MTDHSADDCRPLGRTSLSADCRPRTGPARRSDRPDHQLAHTRAITGTEGTANMIILGLILLLIGYLTGISLLYTVGGIVLVVGIAVFVLGNVGRPVGGRKVWF
jgi:hypothetical protein